MSETFGGKEFTTVCRILSFVWGTFVTFHKACRGPLITYHLVISTEPTESTENIHLVNSMLLRTSEKHEHHVQLTADTAMCVGCIHHSAPGMYISHSLPTPFSLSHTCHSKTHLHTHALARAQHQRTNTHRHKQAQACRNVHTDIQKRNHREDNKYNISHKLSEIVSFSITGDPFKHWHRKKVHPT